MIRDISALHFLVVEDHGFQRWAAENVLRALGATRISSAEDGQKALEVLGKSLVPVDLILCDLRMPGMDGIEFIRRAQEISHGAGIILISEQDPALMDSVAAMVRAYGGELLRSMSKPLTREKLMEAMATYRPAIDRTCAGSAHAITRTEIDAGLRNSEFEPFFQAKVELPSQAMKGAEALARWRHPLHGLLPATNFMDALEAVDRVNEVSEAIIAKAADCCKAWRAAGASTTLAVNLALPSLSDTGLADRLEAMVEEAGLNPSDVIFEVTETAAARHLGPVLENLSRLRLKGFGLSLDDYGTGYASMQQLSRVPFTEIKIDQSFVRGALTSAASRAMVESSLEIAAKLGIPAVAEGVENGEQHRLLVALRCPFAQGFFYGRPMPCEVFTRSIGRYAA
jgi:EAL domain-containing protein (putative c-di-GMP-specific phosphodiesterase class I)/CheY-like chemotaxis protein